MAFMIPKGAAEVAKVASKDTGRFALNGVHVETGPVGSGSGVTLTATDGERLLQVSYNGEPAGAPEASGVYSAKDFSAAMRATATAKLDAALDIDAETGELVLTGRGATMRVRRMEAKYPDTLSVIPDLDGMSGTPGQVGFTPDLLAGLVSALGKAIGTERMRLQLGDDKAPVRIDAREGSYAAIGVIMPRGLE